MARRISIFTPDFDAAYWQVIGDFVLDAVTEAQPHTPYQVRELLTITARHVLYCWQTLGLPLERTTIFQRGVIAEYIERGCPNLTPGSRGCRRAQLFRMAEVLVPDVMPPRPGPIPAAEPAHPYTPAELISLRSWARGQTTGRKRRDCLTLLALSIGTGLSATEIGLIKARHIVVDEDGVLVVVEGQRNRTVPVLTQWGDVLIEAAAEVDPESYLFCPAHIPGAKNLVTNFINGTHGVEIRPNTHRMRATWIASHMAAGTPLVPLMEAAGVQSLEAFTRYLRFLPAVDPAHARRRLHEGRDPQLNQHASALGGAS